MEGLGSNGRDLNSDSVIVMFLGKTLNFHSAYLLPEQTISEARRNAGEAWKGNGKHPVQGGGEAIKPSFCREKG